MYHEKEELTVGTVSIICSMHIALWEGKTKAEQELCLSREGANVAKRL